MNTSKLIGQAITFDDVLLVPRFSEVVPSEVNVGTQLTRNIRLNIPLLSSPMDTVTESDMAIALAQEGGLGVIHKNMSVAQQTEEVDKVKRSANGIIFDPVTLPPTATVAKAREMMNQANISGVPIVASNKKLVGIITRRDMRFLETSDTPISEIMTREKLVTAQGTVTLAEAEKILMANKVEKLLLVDEDYTLTGLITIKDIDMQKRFPQACKDKLGRLRVGAAIGVHDFERAESLIGKAVDVLVVDSAHGHSANVMETVRTIKKRWKIDVVAGNVATKDGAADLIAAGADAVKVGIGPGSICTTRVISGVGVPQVTAIMDAVEAAERGRRADRGRRRHPLFRRHHQSDCRGGERGDDRRIVRRHRRKPGTTNFVSGKNVQGVPGHGFPGRHGERIERTISPRTRTRTEQVGARRRGRPSAVQRPAEHVRVSVGRRPESRHGLLGNPRYRRAAKECTIHSGIARQCAGEPST